METEVLPVLQSDNKKEALMYKLHHIFSYHS